MKLDEKALGYAAAITSAIVMLVLGILGNFGLYDGAVEIMLQWHMFFDLSFFGIVLGMIEAAIISYILAFTLAVLYNSRLKKS